MPASNSELEVELAQAKQQFHDHIVQCVERGNMNERDHKDIKYVLKGVCVLIVSLFGYLLAHNHLMQPQKEWNDGAFYTRSFD